MKSWPPSGLMHNLCQKRWSLDRLSSHATGGVTVVSESASAMYPKSPWVSSAMPAAK